MGIIKNEWLNELERATALAASGVDRMWQALDAIELMIAEIKSEKEVRKAMVKTKKTIRTSKKPAAAKTAAAKTAAAKTQKAPARARKAR